MPGRMEQRQYLIRILIAKSGFLSLEQSEHPEHEAFTGHESDPDLA